MISINNIWYSGSMLTLAYLFNFEQGTLEMTAFFDPVSKVSILLPDATASATFHIQVFRTKWIYILKLKRFWRLWQLDSSLQFLLPSHFCHGKIFIKSERRSSKWIWSGWLTLHLNYSENTKSWSWIIIQECTTTIQQAEWGEKMASAVLLDIIWIPWFNVANFHGVSDHNWLGSFHPSNS